MEKLWNTLKQGLKKYCVDNGFSDVMLGLSGGLDSAIVSVLAAETLGGEHVHTLMMKTRYTSQLSLDIAQKISELNGFEYRVIDIQNLCDTYTDFFSQQIGGAPKSVVVENLQARIRGQILMTFSNQLGYLILACGNKSEAATGYCTLYGDTCGGLMPIGDVYKSKLFELAKWLNTRRQVLPEEVINRAPSAELSAGQKDEDSLPPYAILDAVLQMYVDEHKTIEEIKASGLAAKTVDWTIKQYHKTAYKRKQMPEILTVDFKD